VPVGAHWVQAQAIKPLKIGVLNDMTGLYADHMGMGSVVCARMAVEDFAARAGVLVEIVFADHQNKLDVGLGIVRQ
jgi:branched-chain amino acid transport system substrate-binding protein